MDSIAKEDTLQPPPGVATADDDLAEDIRQCRQLQAMAADPVTPLFDALEHLRQADEILDHHGLDPEPYLPNWFESFTYAAGDGVLLFTDYIPPADQELRASQFQSAGLRVVWVGWPDDGPRPPVGMTLSEHQRSVRDHERGCRLLETPIETWWSDTPGELPNADAADVKSLPHSGNLNIASQQDRSEIDNGKRLVRSHGDDFRYVVEQRKFLVWDGRRWARDSGLLMESWAKEVEKQLWQEFAEAAAEADDDDRKAMLKFIQQSGTAKSVKATLEMARSESGVAVSADTFDRDPWLLNSLTHTIDLRTFEERPHAKQDYLTKLCPVSLNQAAKCPLWDGFIASITCNDPELARYLQTAVGFCLTGCTSEHVLFFCYGTGANGKSTFLNTIQRLMGDYGMKAPKDLLTKKLSGSHTTELTDLAGKRFVSSIEFEDGRAMAEALVKELTGGDSIRARRMREDNWEFRPTHKIWLAANHRPSIRGMDDGIWRRIRLIPFNASFSESEQDKQLPEKLAGELPGILLWALHGLMTWQEAGGLVEPACVRQATAAYRRDMDTIGKFIDDRCTVGPDYYVKAGELYAAYSEWAGKSRLSQRAFSKSMAEKNFETRKNNCILYLGIALMPDAPLLFDPEREPREPREAI